MSIKFSTVYAAKAGDSLASIASAFRLSSHRALSGIPANAGLGNPAPGAALRPGTKVHVPPNAFELLKERIYALHAIRPMLETHFNEQHAHASREVIDGALVQRVPSEPAEAEPVLAGLRGMVADAVGAAARASAPLAHIGLGMCETHVATSNDRSIPGSTVGELTGLYWLLSGNYVGAWSNMWDTDLWVGKWSGRDAPTAARLVLQHINTIRSVVVQQLDARLRESLALERQLRCEA